MLQLSQFQRLQLAEPIYTAATPQGLPAAEYQELSAAFPEFEPEATSGLGKQRVCAWEVLYDPKLPKVWRNFWERHLHPDFALEVLDFWKDAIAKVYPQVSTLTPTIRMRGNPEQKTNFEFDGQFVQRDPASAKSSSGMQPHLDNASSLIFLLWYFRHPKDFSNGGDLTFYKFDGEPTWDKKGRYPAGPVSSVAVMPYSANFAVMTLNTPVAIHGISARNSRYPRRNITMTIELADKSKLF